MSSYLERAASGRAQCQVCGNPIRKSELRTVDETTYWVEGEERTKTACCHLMCAVDIRRGLAYAALVSTRTKDETFLAAIRDVAKSDPKLVDESRAQRQRKVESKPAMALDDPLTGQLLADLEAAPDDRGLLGVLADQLQQRGDERGELVMLDLNAGALEIAAIQRRAQLAKTLSPALQPSDRATWGIGFFHKLELRAPTAKDLKKVLAHPTCRLLQTLELTQAGEVLLTTKILPRSLRFLWLHGRFAPDSEIASLGYLERVRTGGFTTLAHPTLRRLELEMADHATLRAMSREDLPALVELSLVRHRGDGPVCELARTGWFKQLHTLELEFLVFEPYEVTELEEALAGRRLRCLRISGTGMTEALRPRLAALCEELSFTSVAPPRQRDEVIYYDHANKPEWGRGKLVRQYDGKVDVQFASGTRTFKADAPFLKKVIE